MKTEFICVNPRSKVASDRFYNRMDNLHSCKVQERKNGRVYLKSISGRYLFSISESGDDHWEIIK